MTAIAQPIAKPELCDHCNQPITSEKLHARCRLESVRAHEEKSTELRRKRAASLSAVRCPTLRAGLARALAVAPDDDATELVHAEIAKSTGAIPGGLGRAYDRAARLVDAAIARTAAAPELGVSLPATISARASVCFAAKILGPSMAENAAAAAVDALAALAEGSKDPPEEWRWLLRRLEDLRQP